MLFRSVQPGVVNAPKKKNIALIIVCVALALCLVAAVVFFIVPNLGKTNSSNTASSSTPAASSQSSSNSSSSDSQYNTLKTYYDKLDGYSSRVTNTVNTFNADYLKGSESTRKSDYSSANSLKSSIDSEYNSFSSALTSNGITSGTAYYQQGQNILRCYKLLSLRTDVVCQAWAIDVGYSNPSAHESAITAPIGAAQEGGTSKYKTEWESLYPSSAPQKM